MRKEKYELTDELKTKALLFMDSINRNNNSISELQDEIKLRQLEIEKIEKTSEIDKIKFFKEIKEKIPEPMFSHSRSLERDENNNVYLIENILESGDKENENNAGNSDDINVNQILERLDLLKSLLRMNLDNKNDKNGQNDESEEENITETPEIDNLLNTLEELKDLFSDIPDDDDNDNDTPF